MSELKKLKREVKRLDKKLAPYFEGQPLINKVWLAYNEDSELGRMLRRRDKLWLQIYRMEEGNGTERRPDKGAKVNS